MHFLFLFRQTNLRARNWLLSQNVSTVGVFVCKGLGKQHANVDTEKYVNNGIAGTVLN